MIAGETGEALVEAMAAMQARQNQAATALETATRLDRSQVGAAFAAARSAREATGAGPAADRRRLPAVRAGADRLAQPRACCDRCTELSLGLGRFGQGDFARPVEVTQPGRAGRGRRAGQPDGRQPARARRAARPQRVADPRAGRAGPRAAGRAGARRRSAARAVRFLAGYLEAPAGALYRRSRRRRPGAAGPTTRCAAGKGRRAAGAVPAGEGLLGQAGLGEELLVIDDPPAGYLRVRSGAGRRRAPGAGAAAAGPQRPGARRARAGAVQAGRRGDPGAPALGARDAGHRPGGGRRPGWPCATCWPRPSGRRSGWRPQEEELRANNEELQAQQEELRQANEELEQQRRDAGAAERRPGGGPAAAGAEGGRAGQQ